MPAGGGDGEETDGRGHSSMDGSAHSIRGQAQEELVGRDSCNQKSERKEPRPWRFPTASSPNG